MEWAKSKAQDEIGFVQETAAVGGGGDRKKEGDKVMAAMGIDPRARKEQAQIEKQNDRLQSYLSSLKKQQ